MIAILFTARNGPNPVPQDARAHSLCRAEGVMVTQYRIGANAFRFAASSRPLDSSGETERSRGVAARSIPCRWRALSCAAPRCDFRRSWFLRRNSSERLGAAIFKIRVDALADSVRTEHRPVRFGALPSCHRGCAVEGG